MSKLETLLENNERLNMVEFERGEIMFFNEHVAPDGLADWNKHSINREPYNAKYKTTVRSENGILYRGYQLLARWRWNMYLDKAKFIKDKTKVIQILDDLTAKDENGNRIKGVYCRNAGRNSVETNYPEDTRLFESHDNIVMICALINVYGLNDTHGVWLNDYYNKYGGTLNNNLNDGKWFWRWRSYRLPYDGGIYALTGNSVPKPLQVFWSVGQFVLYGIQNIIRKKPHVHHGGLCYARFVSIYISMQRLTNIPKWMQDAWYCGITFYKFCYVLSTDGKGIQWFFTRKVNNYDDPMKPFWKGIVW